MMILAGLLGLVAIGGVALARDMGPTENGEKSAAPSGSKGQRNEPADNVVNLALPKHGDDQAEEGDQPDAHSAGGSRPDEDSVRVMEFDPFVDRLVLLCNLENDSYPDLVVHREPGVSRVSLNGRDLARIRTKKPISVDEIVLVDHCDPAAQGLGAMQMQ